MASRAIWKGSISFGLVQIPVDLNAAEQPKDLSFRQLDKHDFSPIGYERINKNTGAKVSWDDIVRGFERDPGEYVVLTDQELDDANVEATHMIDIVAFVDAKEIDPMYFEKPYWLTPSKRGAKPYALLRQTLEDAGRVGVATVVIRARQRLCAIMPHGDALALITMRYAHEIRAANKADLPHGKTDVTKSELEMAKMLVNAMAAKWEPKNYQDTYRDDVLALVEKKANAGEINTITEPTHEHRAKPQPNVLDLMSLLKQSLGEKGVSQAAPGLRRAAPKRVSHRSHARRS